MNFRLEPYRTKDFEKKNYSRFLPKNADLGFHYKQGLYKFAVIFQSRAVFVLEIYHYTHYLQIVRSDNAILQ